MTRLEKIAVFVIALLGLTVGGLLIFRPKPQPVPIPQSTIELAAQHAATAIVAVAKNVEVHGKHVATTHKVATIAARIDSLHEVVTPAQAAKDTIITELVADNARLDSAVVATIPVLASDTTVRIHQDSTPATPLKILGPSIIAKVGHALLSNVTVGYGALYENGSISTGPSASIGVHLTSGTIGVTAGGVAIYAGGSIHLGAGATLGVRL